ncbi:MAG: hypothetical protein E6Q36_08600 [Chryseobacterium sp.]|nr:MAG: hypothetical protein E6Q36_08600 [Chryseobacterium sp.]
MNLITKLEKEGWLILYGGADIDPKIYNKENYKSYISSYSIQRDKQEIQEYKAAVKKGRPIFGICRGMQLMSALNGLSLIQDMSHGGTHWIKALNTKDGTFNTDLVVNNAHHQCVWTENKLEGDRFKIYGYCNISPYHHYQEKEIVDCKVEPEIMYFPKVKGFGTQFHPEWMGDIEKEETLQYLENTINTLF